ncbi:MAG: Sodium/proton antiporter, CPA1 family [uncultured bacterium]|nr:MAG: Sodium/proton antiporter, CPA1 family [uncultured bacterium]
MRKILKYTVAAISVLALVMASNAGKNFYSLLGGNSEGELLSIFFITSTLFVLSFLVFYLSHLINLPSFVVAIILGIAAKPLLAPIVHHEEILAAIVGVGATLILFSGGLEIPFKNFRKLIWKISAISFLGLLITAFLFSWAVWILAPMFGMQVSIIASVLLGALLASTDPAAIIPVLKKLRFKNRSIKEIIISESAVTDVVGTLLTMVFISLALANTNFSSINQWYLSVFSDESAIILTKQLLFGTLLGTLGYFFLELLLKLKKRFGQEFEADSALFISIPIIIFTVAIFMGGSGYLAAFVAGLVFHITEHLKETENFFNNLVDGFMKPIIFILLGALVNLPNLINYAPIGIFIALIFMFVIRPIAVFVSLGYFTKFGQEKLSVRDLFFISFVRETGAIPAVLMLTVTALGLRGMEGLVEIGMWSILLTLIIEPMLTPAVAKYLKVAEVMKDEDNIALSNIPAIMLVTRGKSFIDRFPFVDDWAQKHGISKIVVMLCLENKYSPELEKEIEDEANHLFKKTNSQMNAGKEMRYRFISRKGSLTDNINNISQTDHRIISIFVGKKMLDFYPQEIKDLSIPFYFMD